MNFHTIISVFVTFAYTSAKGDVTPSTDAQYSSVCDSCKSFAPMAVSINAVILPFLKPLFYAECDRHSTPGVNSSIGLVVADIDIASPTFASECRGRIDYGFGEAVLFAEDLARSPDEIEEFCRAISCASPKLEDINRRIFKTKSEGNVDLACTECQQLVVPEATRISEDPELTEKFKNFLELKFCPRTADIKHCKVVIGIVVPTMVGKIRESFANRRQICTVFGPCEVESEKTSPRSFEEL